MAPVRYQSVPGTRDLLTITQPASQCSEYNNNITKVWNSFQNFPYGLNFYSDLEFDFQDIAILIDFESLINNSLYPRQPKLNMKLSSEKIVLMEY